MNVLTKPIFAHLLDREDIIKDVVRKEENAMYEKPEPWKTMRVEIPKTKRSVGLWNFIRGLRP